ncbi:MAG: hypothetical protein ACYS29_06750 [Planctomycetota bacterium]
MCKKLMFLISLVLVLGLASSVFATDYRWTNDYPWSMLWISPWNWDPVAPYGGPGADPCSIDNAYIEHGPAQGPVVDTSVTIQHIRGPDHAEEDIYMLVKDYADMLVTGSWEGRDRGDDGAGTAMLEVVEDARIYINDSLRLWDRGPGHLKMSDNASISCRWMHFAYNYQDPPLDPYDRTWVMDGNSYLETRDGDCRFYLGNGVFDISDTAVLDVDYRLYFRSRVAGNWIIYNQSGDSVVNVGNQLRHGFHQGNVEVNISGGTLNTGDDWRMGADNDFSTDARVNVNISGGEMNVGDSWGFPTHYEAKGFITVDMTGGVVNVGDEMYHDTDDWIVYICGDGVIIIEGDHVDQILDEATSWDQTGINNHPELEQDGHWIACPAEDCRGEVVARGTLMVDFNNVNPAKTTIWAELALDEAWSPPPEDGGTDVPTQGAQLCWCAPDVEGGIKDQHVFFSTDCDAVEARDPAAFLVQAGPGDGETCVDLPCLAMCTTYCWAVDIQDHYTNIVRGPVWSFTTECCRMIEPFDQYTLDPWNLIYKAWKDGCGVWVGDELVGNGTGSCVNLGMDNTQDGPKAMIYTYENDWMSLWERDVNYSESCKEFDPALDLECADDKALVIYFYGDGDNDVTDMWVKLNDVKSTYGANGEDAADIQLEEWIDWNTKLSDFADGGADLSAITEICIGFGDDETGIADGTYGMMLFDSIQTCASRCVTKFLPECFGDHDDDCDSDWGDVGVIADWWLTDRR